MPWDPAFRFYPIIDTAVCASHGVDPRHAAAACVRAGARLLQVRMKSGSSAAFLALADAVVSGAAPAGTTVIVNDRPDIARMSRAGGVHVGQDDLPPDEVRAVLGPGLVGVSTHSLQQVDQAWRTSADYLAVGPIFGTSTKATGYEPRGLDLVRHAARGGTPVIAIGGMTLSSAREVLAAGASAVAVISDLLAEGDIEKRARAYIERLRG